MTKLENIGYNFSQYNFKHVEEIEVPIGSAFDAGRWSKLSIEDRLRFYEAHYNYTICELLERINNMTNQLDNKADVKDSGDRDTSEGTCVHCDHHETLHDRYACSGKRDHCICPGFEPGPPPKEQGPHSNEATPGDPIEKRIAKKLAACLSRYDDDPDRLIEAAKKLVRDIPELRTQEAKPEPKNEPQRRKLKPEELRQIHNKFLDAVKDQQEAAKLKIK